MQYILILLLYKLAPTPTKSKPKPPKRPQHRKLYVQVKGTEDMIEIDVDKNRPKSFASQREASEWEEKTLRDILKFKKLVEDGKFVPEEVVQRLEARALEFIFGFLPILRFTGAPD